MTSAVVVVNNGSTDCSRWEASIRFLVGEMGHEVQIVSDTNSHLLLQRPNAEICVPAILDLTEEEKLGSSAARLSRKFATAVTCTATPLSVFKALETKLDQRSFFPHFELPEQAKSSLAFMLTNIHRRDFRMSHIAKAAGQSESTLAALFRESVGKSVRQQLIDMRMFHAARLAIETKLDNYGIATAVGVDDRHVGEAFVRKHNQTIRDLRIRGGRGYRV